MKSKNSDYEDDAVEDGSSIEVDETLAGIESANQILRTHNIMPQPVKGINQTNLQNLN